MSDLEVLKQLLSRANIEFSASPDGDTTIMVEGGYNGFYTVFSFDKDGKLLEMGAYE